MKKINYLIALLFVVLITTNTDAQIGSLKNLKNKAKNSVGNSKKSSTSVTKSKYQKYMDEGYKYKDEKNDIEALKSFKKALNENPGDYSAKNQVQQLKSSVTSQIEKKVKSNLEEGKCDEAKKYVEQGAELEVYNSRDINYYNKEIEKCKASASKNKDAKANQAKISSLADGSGNFYTDFAKKDFKSTVSVGDNLFVKFKFDKVMTDYFEKFGIEKDFSAYGYFTLYINGKKIFTDGPYHFPSNYSKVWKTFDVPLSTSPDFAKQLQSNPSLLATNQDVWLLQQTVNPTGISSKYVMAAIQNMTKNGTYKVKIEFGLGEKSEGKPKGTVATGELTVKVDAAGKKELYKRGPKYMRPLEDNEKGKFTFSNNSYEFGSSNLSTTLSLPNPPKYYNMKWCKSSSCDYDHGEIMFEVELDDKYLASWQTTLWNEDYETKKQFSSIIITANDKDFNNDLSKFNSSDFFKKTGNNNPVVYALYDLLYSGKLSTGKHTLKLKAMSPESTPPGLTYEASKNYYDKITTAIAENTLTFNVTSSTKSKLEATSAARKLKHAGGSWASVDAYLKNSSTDGLATILDVATTTQWKVTVNSLGTPLYRECKANVIYKSKNGATREIHGVGVKEDYQGGKYSKPYFTDVMNNYYTANSGFLGPMHFPVPYSKVK